MRALAFLVGFSEHGVSYEGKCTMIHDSPFNSFHQYEALSPRISYCLSFRVCSRFQWRYVRCRPDLMIEENMEVEDESLSGSRPVKGQVN